MPETGLTVPDIYGPLSRYNVTVSVGCDGGYLPDPAAFAAAADQAAWGRSASISSAHLADKIISVVTVTASHRYAAVAVARAVVSDALKRQALSSSQPADDGAQHRAEPAPGMAMHNIQARRQRAGRQPRAVEQPTTRRSLDNRAPTRR
jgi:hypothetical protein